MTFKPWLTGYVWQIVVYTPDVTDRVFVCQVSLFQSISPLFKNKPFMVVCNKTDVVTLADLPEDKQVKWSDDNGDDGSDGCLKLDWSRDEQMRQRDTDLQFVVIFFKNVAGFV